MQEGEDDGILLNGLQAEDLGNSKVAADVNEAEADANEAEAEAKG